ncbi:uncharacterized protein LOC132260130 isoform X1 [Phlebotomus argentipes]|uniref:uncharacterized protein LOC132260130 isoform X1 n=1 Tax=Phlebotomus argentipes TaxID=94469 RepID=UPI0028937741|nr:uncharacterized protein LOC132260130 isoform X1 [Phlebotomus argentipes]
MSDWMVNWTDDDIPELAPRPVFIEQADWNWKYSKVLTNLLLCGSCSFALYALRRESLLARSPYIAMLSHGMIGCVKPILDNSVVNYVYEASSKMARIGILPLVSAQIATEVLCEPHMGFLHICLFTLPIVAHPILRTFNLSDHIYDCVALTAEVYLGCMATIENRMSWSLLVEGDFINRFFLTNIFRRSSLPSKELYALGLAVLCFLGPLFTHNIKLDEIL